MSSESNRKKTSDVKSARYAYEGLERVFHEKARLGIVTCLARYRDGLLFPELKTLCDLTDGNLNRHLHQLELEEIVKMDKRFEGNRPQTNCRLTADGLKRFRDYLDHLQRALEDARSAQQSATALRNVSKTKSKPSWEGA